MTTGILRGIEDGWFMSEIAEAAFAYQIALEKGEKKIVGVNCHTDSVEPRAGDPAGLATRSSASRCAALAERAGPAATRPRSTPRSPRMVEVAGTTENMIPAMLDAARAEATLGEICDALRDEWGVYREPARF